VDIRIDTGLSFGSPFSGRSRSVPLVEFAVDGAPASKSIATMNPGLSYVAVTWQIAVEAIIPLNNASGPGIGGRTQLLLFLDDLAPSLFGKPLLSR
jgi:hypothetical protein